MFKNRLRQLILGLIILIGLVMIAFSYRQPGLLLSWEALASLCGW